MTVWIALQFTSGVEESRNKPPSPHRSGGFGANEVCAREPIAGGRSDAILVKIAASGLGIVYLLWCLWCTARNITAAMLIKESY